ncbi:unnamed protein product [Bursaphelenchus xylophilus]|nr:unnamed protein product [Bursaphelenchus xylophilus]CAG9126604.1 unnamed protein product [Bursaphelenchus xylophilus]
MLSPGFPVSPSIHPYLALFAAEAGVTALGMRGIFKQDRSFIKFFILAMIYLVLLQWTVSALCFVDGSIFFGVFLVVYSVVELALLVVLLVFKSEPAPKWMLYAWPFNEAGIREGPLTGGVYDEEAVTTAFGSAPSKPFVPTESLESAPEKEVKKPEISAETVSLTNNSAATISNPVSRVPSVNCLDTPSEKHSKASTSTCSCADCKANCAHCQELEKGEYKDKETRQFTPTESRTVPSAGALKTEESVLKVEEEPDLQEIPVIRHVKTPLKRSGHLKSSPRLELDPETPTDNQTMKP